MSHTGGARGRARASGFAVVTAACVLAIAGCGAMPVTAVDGGDDVARGDGSTSTTDGARDDSASEADASSATDAATNPDTMVMPPSGIAPPGAIEGDEVRARDGENTVMRSAAGEAVFRVDAAANEHIGFHLTFAPAGADILLDVLRWDGATAVRLGTTDGGSGLRTLAAFDPEGPRTFWARVRAIPAGSVPTLRVTRTPFADGARCTEDCERLLQLPLPIDPARDGYDTDGGTVFRYQFGRRDMLMFLRHAGRTVAAAGMAPFVPYDISQWDGLTPGSDTGSLRHASHQRGKDVDISLYGLDGMAPWRSYCTTQSTSEGRQCVNGTARNFDGYANARMVADFYATGRVTMCFLDTELIEILRPEAARAADDGVFDRALLALFNDGRHVQNWPNHDNHIHVRLSEEPYAGGGGGEGRTSVTVLPEEPFEAP